MADIAKDLSISLLLDFYGDMLTEKQREVVELYYNEDLSLAEIANISGITRQGVRDSIKRGEKTLLDCEEKLGLFEKFHSMQNDLRAIKECAQEAILENSKTSNSPIIHSQLETIIEKTKSIDK